MFNKWIFGHLRSPHKIIFIILVKPKSNFSISFWISCDITFKDYPKWQNG